jgi:hypothetical protein
MRLSLRIAAAAAAILGGPLPAAGAAEPSVAIYVPRMAHDPSDPSPLDSLKSSLVRLRGMIVSKHGDPNLVNQLEFIELDEKDMKAALSWKKDALAIMQGSFTRKKGAYVAQNEVDFGPQSIYPRRFFQVRAVIQDRQGQVDNTHFVLISYALLLHVWRTRNMAMIDPMADLVEALASKESNRLSQCARRVKELVPLIRANRWSGGKLRAMPDQLEMTCLSN